MTEPRAADPLESSAGLPSLGPYLIACAVAAAWISFGSIHRDQHSDSILNVLISLQCWTPFVWEQDRFGMAIPLLAVPIKHPLANMIFQAFLVTFAGLATFFLLARSAFRDPTYPQVGTLGALSLLVLTPPYYRFEYLVDTSYGTSLALALWGLILVEPTARSRSWPRWVAALVLMGLAHWINSVTALFLGPFLLMREAKPLVSPIGRMIAEKVPLRGRLPFLVVELGRTEAFRGLIVLAAGYEIGQFLISLCPYQPTNYSGLPWNEWADSWRQLIRKNQEALDPPVWPLAMAIEAILGSIGLVWVGRPRARSVAWTALSLVVAAVALWLLLGTRTWVKINVHAFRYLFPSFLLMQTAVAGLAIAGLRRDVAIGRRTQVGFAALALVLIVGASAWSYGFPSVAGVRRDIDRRCGALTEDLLAAHCTCLAGDFWTVWISVFHANLVLYEKENRVSKPFWGLTYRAGPTFQLWRHDPIDRCVAGVANGDGVGEIWLKSYPFPKFEVVEIRPKIRVYRAIPTSRRGG